MVAPASPSSVVGPFPPTRPFEECGEKLTNPNLHMTLMHKKKPVPRQVGKYLVKRRIHDCPEVMAAMSDIFMKKVHCNELSEPDPPTFKDTSRKFH